MRVTQSAQRLSPLHRLSDSVPPQQDKTDDASF